MKFFIYTILLFLTLGTVNSANAFGPYHYQCQFRSPGSVLSKSPGQYVWSYVMFGGADITNLQTIGFCERAIANCEQATVACSLGTLGLYIISR